MTNRDAVGGDVRCGLSNRSVEEHVEKITGYFRFLPGAARLRPLFFITLGGPQAHGHSLPVTARNEALVI